ncbi:putative bacteriophage lysozyme [Liberibacter crescens BT-1]|uniref:Lysozyme n=1 Tax=Liberibacter crescens (strain BT-1) TaxID=1215343 RepID=L0EUX5_LIBCB|nr:lysozyme [Liberibacter crescens]AGA64762.1 putative bacteriophage lysozyme [Liberibacter crescens BT-1]AMC12835.1 hypothetical protein RL73_03905 [Liberibacter crescens]
MFAYKNSLKTSSAGIEFIKKKEGFIPRVYSDPAELPTIGYGHLIRKGENWTTITREEAEQLLKRELCEVEETVNSHVTIPLSQNQFDALVSFTFNVGSHAFSGSTLLHYLNLGSFKDAANQFLRWNKIHIKGQAVSLQGLSNRRKAERDLFLQDDEAQETVMV